MNLKYLLLFVCLVQVQHYCYANGDPSLSNELDRFIAPKCLFVPEALSLVVYTREYQDGVLLTLKKLTNSGIFKNCELSSNKVIFLIHGLLSSANNTNYADMRRALLDKDDYVLISVDWRDPPCRNTYTIPRFLGYPKPLETIGGLGYYIAFVSKILIQKYKVPVENIRLIGHSLGAQIAGFAGKEFQKFQLGKYSEIIGLDPAWANFKTEDCSKRICETDAHYVQILYTSNYLGTENALGTVDFIINDGNKQPGCGSTSEETCSHTRVVNYFTECIRSECCLIGVPVSKNPQRVSKCTRNECVCVGLNAKKYPKTGLFYVQVEANASPFCNNHGKII